MKFKIDFTTLPSIEVEIDADLVEAFAMHYCTTHGLDPSTGKGPMPLQIARVPDGTECPECGNTELQLSHNTLSAYCHKCGEWFEEETGE